jgi:Uma2 family endonuclease
MAVAREHLTLEQFLQLPEEEPALEFADGAVTQKVSPKGKHSLLQATLVELLNRAGRDSRAALAFPELRTTFSGASRVPDISVYTWGRIPTDAKGRVANDFVEPPDVVIEIVSPEQTSTALVRRCPWFVAHGVPIALLVDASDKSVLVFAPDNSVTALRGTERIALSDVLPDFSLTVQDLFRALQLT